MQARARARRTSAAMGNTSRTFRTSRLRRGRRGAWFGESEEENHEHGRRCPSGSSTINF
jgi:hypothetical protein